MMRLKVIKPKFPSTAQWQKAIDKALDKTARYGIRMALKPTVDTWDKKAKFEVLHETKFSRFIGTTNTIWVMLNEGTRAHEIRAKNAKRLAFMAGGSPKSVPNQLQAVPGSTGNTQVFAVVVHHPGTEPRRWDKAAAKKIQPELVQNMRSELAIALRLAK